MQGNMLVSVYFKHKQTENTCKEHRKRVFLMTGLVYEKGLLSEGIPHEDVTSVEEHVNVPVRVK